MEPYYSDDHVTIYHGDNRDILANLEFDLIVTDPPYGIDLNTSYASATRTNLAQSNDYPPIYGDDEPFDPTWIIDLDKPTVLFGANHYATRLPDESRWLVWDKIAGLTSKREIGFCHQSDVELAWTNLGGAARLFSHRWMGMLKDGRDASTRRRHPTEKPIELMSWVMAQCPDGTVLDPYMGSGPTLQACKERGRKAIGIEIEERYCEIAARRMGQEVLAFPV